jgi:hypothetical protein
MGFGGVHLTGEWLQNGWLRVYLRTNGVPFCTSGNKKPPRGGSVFLGDFKCLRLGCGGWI